MRGRVVALDWGWGLTERQGVSDQLGTGCKLLMGHGTLLLIVAWLGALSHLRPLLRRAAAEPAALKPWRMWLDGVFAVGLCLNCDVRQAGHRCWQCC